jgi:hypothetical protein
MSFIDDNEEFNVRTLSRLASCPERSNSCGKEYARCI